MAEIRAFIAIAVAPPILARLAAVQEELRRLDADVSWTRPEAIHITLKFLGEIPETHIAPLGEILTQIARRQSVFAITVAGTGVFPAPTRARVLWAGITEGTAALTTLAHAVDTATAAYGYPRETRPFHPHLTLGRVRSPRGIDQLLEHLGRYAHECFGDMRAKGLALLRSDLRPQGVQHTLLHHSDFGG